MSKLTEVFHNLLADGGISSSRLINIGVFIGLSVAMFKMTWAMDDIAKDATMWYWACFTSYATYGMGTANWGKWLDIIHARVGCADNQQPPKE